MSELKKCPFCGGEHIIKTYFNWNPALLCSCGVVMTVPMDWRTNKEEELERKWNTRKPVDDVVEALKKPIWIEHTDDLTLNEIAETAIKQTREVAIERVKEILNE